MMFIFPYIGNVIIPCKLFVFLVSVGSEGLITCRRCCAALGLVLPRAGAHLEAHLSAGAPQKTMERSTMLFSWVKSLCWVVYGCRFMVDLW